MIELSDRHRAQGGLQPLSTFAPFFRASRENANNLYGALKNGWNCYCSTAHRVMLQLERKLDRGEDEFKILCVMPSAIVEDEFQVSICRILLVCVDLFNREAV